MSLPRPRSLLVLSFVCAALLLLLASTPAAAIKKKLSEKELAAIEDQWMEDEQEDEDDTPFKYTKTADGGRVPPSPSGPKTEMGFVTLKAAAGWTKKKTDELAGRWSDQMMSAGIDVRGYTIEDNRILFVCDQRGYKDMNRVRAFLLQQKETLEFEWNSKKSYPGAVPLDDSGEPAAADPLSKFQAMQDEQAAAAKRAARKLRKDEENRQREMRQAKERAEKQRKREADKKKKEAAKKQQEQVKAAAEAANAAQQQQQQQQQQAKQPEVHTEL